VTAPGAPQNVAAAVSSSTVTVTWLPPIDNGGATVSSYDVVLKAGASTVASISRSASPAIFASVAVGTYGVEVRARNTSGAGSAGVTSATVVQPGESGAPGDPGGPGGGVVDPGLPSEPVDLIAVAGDAAATLSWSPPGNPGSSPIIGYKASSIPEGAQCEVVHTTCLLKGLTNGVSYTFVVSAANSAGFGPASAPSNAIIPRAVESPAPEPSPAPDPKPVPTPGVIDFPGNVRTQTGDRVRVALVVSQGAPLRDLRLITRVGKKNLTINARFVRTRPSGLRAVFSANVKPGRYVLRLVQIVDGKRIALSRTRLIVTR